MSQVTKQTVKQSALTALYEPIAGELCEVEELLRGEMRSDYPFVHELVRYGCLLGGKRLRPALVLLTAKALGEVRREHLVLATVMEMIHTATLVHDDVLDRAELRRHIATVNSRWDTEASILLGDFLFTHSFYLASTLQTTEACQRIGRATNLVCEGELRQKGSRGNFELSEDEYLSIIDAKTAELCACSCWLGARYAGASPELQSSLEAFGRELGIAFQIADDLLDVIGEEGQTGKSLGTDFDQRIPTLPLIQLLRSLPDPGRRALIERLRMSEDDATLSGELNRLFDEYGSIAYARERARSIAADARHRLDALDDSPSKQVLTAMSEFVVQRVS